VSSSIVVNLRLPPELAEAMRARAVEEERTASAVIRRALKRDLEREPASRQGVGTPKEGDRA
jgi:hypothetical protein